MDCVASSSPLLGITSAGLTLIVLIYREVLRQRTARNVTHSKLDAVAAGVEHIAAELEAGASSSTPPSSAP